MTRRTAHRTLVLLVGAALLASCRAATPEAAARTATAPPGSIELATWNLEWLVEPREFRRLAASCVPRDGSPGGRTRFLSCNAARDMERSDADFDALARYARVLDADVIALQEVDGPDAARRVFREHRFCFSRRTAVQNVGFAIRKGIPHRCAPDYEPLALDGRLRRGAVVVLYPGEPREITLMSVHLKSGCARRPLDSDHDDCETLRRQIPVLEAWIDEQAAAGRRFGILGDFNRDLINDVGPARTPDGRIRSLWAEIDDGSPPEADLFDAAEGQRYVDCAPTQNFRSYIDHVVLSRSLAARVVPGSFERVTYEPQDAQRRKLADHCPVAIRVTP